MDVKFLNTEYEKELNEVLRLFFPTFEINENHKIVFAAEKARLENKVIEL